MWYERWAGWGSIKSHWCMVLFLSFSLSWERGGEREADGWRSEIKKLQEKTWSILCICIFLSLLFFVFFSFPIICEASFSRLMCLCVLSCSHAADRCVHRRVFNDGVYEECDMRKVWLPSCSFLLWLLSRCPPHLPPFSLIVLCCIISKQQTELFTRMRPTLCLLYPLQCMDHE